MAELMKESWNDEELLRDSLDSVDESVSSLGATDEMKPVETRDEILGELVAGSHSHATLLTERIEPAESSRKGQNMTDSNNEVKKHTVLKQSKRNGAVLNKTVLTKGRPKMSYSEMYKSRLQRQKPSQKPSQVTDKNELNRGDMSGISPREVENPLMQSGQETIAESGQFKENDFMNGKVSDTYLQYGNTMNAAGYTDLHANSKHDQLMDSGVNDKPFNEHGKLEWTNHYNYTNIARQTSDCIMPNSDVISNNDYNLCNQGLNNSHHNSSLRERQGNVDPLLYNARAVNLSQYLPPIQTIPIYSAPAAIQTYYSGDHQYEIPYQPISLCTSGPGNTYSRYSKHNDSLTSASSAATTKSGAASYSSIYAKQHTGTYEPYTLNDYKRLKHTKPAGLGPNTNSEEYKQKVKKAMRQKEYAAVIRQKHNFDNSEWKKKPSTSMQEKSPKIQEADARRKKALQYAKAVPKPTTTKTHTLKVQAKVNHEEPHTLIDILRQRHEKEREAIDAVRKDLEAKLKTR